MPGFSFTVLWLCLTLNSVGSYAQRRYSGRPEPIGQGVTVHAEVLYDETVMKRENSATELEMKARTPSFGDFQAIFRKVEEHFNNYSVMIKITVGNITKNKNLSVIFEGMKHSLDGPKTLGKLKEYGKQTFASNDTVFYLFTA
ncbi:hypothetical protein V5799_026946 [Amblyomma americanum]|uniref:Secreted protein n=1 Tax=Amblyomma americanum TaxID=6943 RepID=A0AAQ4DH47_AMBAM